MLLFLTSFSNKIELNKLYNPRVLPRAQYYEVMSLIKADEKLCFVQYLAEDYRQSYWGVQKRLIGHDCREDVDNESFLKKQKSSEIFKVIFSKEKTKITFIINGVQRDEWTFSPWNFQNENQIVVSESQENKSSKTDFNINKLEEASFCRAYSRFPKCELVQEEESDCSLCPSGWMYAVGRGCSKNDKICSQSCGAREEIACPQGRVEERESMNLVCPNQVEGAICQKGLSAFCYEDIVYCK